MNRKKLLISKKIPTSYLRGTNISQICRLKKAQKIGEKESLNNGNNFYSVLDHLIGVERKAFGEFFFPLVFHQFNANIKELELKKGVDHK